MKGIIILINNEWYFIGKNPYGNNVEENNNGFRRVEISGGWAYEEQTLIDSLKICRAKTENDLNIAANAMANAEISKSFLHKATIAYLVWMMPAGKQVKIEQKYISFIENSTDKKWLSFKNAVNKSLSKFEKQVLDRFIKGESYVTIAKRLDSPVKSVDNAIQRIRKKAIKNMFNND